MPVQPRGTNKSLSLELLRSEFYFNTISTEIIKVSQFVGQLITSLRQINEAKRLIKATGETASQNIYLFIPLVLLAANDAGISPKETEELLTKTNLVLMLDQLTENGRLINQELINLINNNTIALPTQYRCLYEREQNSVTKIVTAMNKEYQLAKAFQKTNRRFTHKDGLLSTLSSSQDNLAEEYFKISTKSNAADWVIFSLLKDKDREVFDLVNLVNQATRLCLDLATVKKDLMEFTPNIVIIEMIDLDCSLTIAKTRITKKLVSLKQKITRLEEKLEPCKIVKFASSLYRWTEYLTLHSRVTKFALRNLGYIVN